MADIELTRLVIKYHHDLDEFDDDLTTSLEPWLSIGNHATAGNFRLVKW